MALLLPGAVLLVQLQGEAEPFHNRVPYDEPHGGDGLHSLRALREQTRRIRRSRVQILNCEVDVTSKATRGIVPWEPVLA